MSHAAESATESVQSVAFSFLTDEEVRKHSFMKITNPILLNVMGKAVPGGLYDPALGPMDENTPCQSCGQVSRHCPGHCGHIDLVSPVYNPLLFDVLYNILKRVCFFCYHFRANRKELETCTSQLKLILEGDIIGAKKLGSNDPSESTDPEDHDQIQYQNPKLQKKWTSIQLSEALFILNKLLKAKNSKDESVRITESLKCQNCGKRSPKIKKPIFGWLHVSGMPSSYLRGNAIREQHRLNAEEGRNDISPSENGSAVEATEPNATKRDKEGKEVTAEYLQQKQFAGPLLPSEVRHTLKNLWENESELCSLITDIQSQGFGKKAGSSMFFLEAVLVPPIRFRPPTKGGDSVMEHPQTALLTKVLQANIYLANAHDNNKAKVVNRWMDLQQSVNMVYDNKTASGQKEVLSGVIQLLEKKEGIFRQKMMGKRVNFACRSVISPDPYLAVNEIGIPPYFALRLTYPERVTPWNVVKLRDAIDSGPELHPGATHYADKAGTIRLHSRKKIRSATLRKLLSSRGVVMQNGKICDNEFEGKIVYRHLQDGDVVLVNRQPTLHKPSIMAHVVRVLKGEKTLRMHYANCSTYNADFDGDEINVHFPQDEISRAEAYNIVNANNQYVKPTSGEPIRSLIQDHVVSAALLTKRDTFLNSDQFNQLLYSSGVLNSSNNFSGKSDQKVFMSNFSSEILSLPPAIWKPEPLWTGKQVITALLYHLTKGCPPFTMEKGAKIPHDFFKRQYGDDQRRIQGSTQVKVQDEEDKLLIYKNELVRGVIDKAQFGDYGIIHSVHELYGSGVAGNLLSAFSRLFTTYLQSHGFTCGVEDLLLMQKNDNERKKHLEGCEIGEMVHRDFVHDMADGELDSSALQAYIERKICSNGETALTYLDRKMISSLNSKTSSVFFKELLSEGILKPSGRNCIALMTTSGAKGSMVNFQQISSHLGQQELEGKRVPRMVSGKTLPCFPPWDWSARAGGFITDRFLTGLHPQEYYFHCMAGREGLVDTAVKTSRSGYLQRCIIKNLESLRVGYDHTVRDADGSIIQFQYGEDGVDVHQTSYIMKFEALAINEELVCNKLRRELNKSSPYICKLPYALAERAKAFIHDFSLKRRIPAFRQKNFMKLIEHKYLSSLAQPGEPVGVLAGQSVGEPSTQMTLNTFHLAGRGEMNVTLGIPRLQEVLMTASDEIKTPVMTCPLIEGRSTSDATRLADNLKKITVADIIGSMKVSVEKDIKYKHVCSIYKLEMELHKPKHYPKYANISLEDWEETLEVVYLRKLEDDIERHLTLLSKINGIKNFMDDSVSSSSNKRVEDDGDDVSTNGAQAGKNEDDDDDNDGDDTEGAEDLGMDAQKRKKQGLDEFDYDDDAEEPTNEARKEDDVADDEMETVEDDGTETPGRRDLASESLSKVEKSAEKRSGGDKTKSEPKGKKSRAKLNKKDSDRAIFVKAKKMHFEVHFKFINEPHILLSKIATAAAQKVFIQSFGKVDQCKAITCKENQVIYYGKNHRKRNELPASVKEKLPALQTTGVDFTTFWEMQDTLDVRYIYSNSIYAMLTTYGVEAARETIIREVNNVFKSYGISVNIRHLTLIADFMTHTGGYRPLNRAGGIAETISPFTKMSFETASKFIVEAACHGEVDTLETPSARICLGLPVKSGTGSFDLMQKVEI